MSDISQRTQNEENPAEERPDGPAAAGPNGQPAAAAGPNGQPTPAAGPNGQPAAAAGPNGQPTAAAGPNGQPTAAAGNAEGDPASRRPGSNPAEQPSDPSAAVAASTAGRTDPGWAGEDGALPLPASTDGPGSISPFPEPQGSSPWVDPRRAARLANTEPWHRDGTGPVPTASGPVRKRWRKIAFRTLAKAWGDSLFGMSSQAAFWSALSTAPLLLALLGLSGYVARLIGPNTTGDIRQQVNIFLHTIFNEEVADNLIGNTVDVILNNGQADVISVGLIISLWAGSSAMTAFVESINIAYCQHEFRHPVLERFFALGLYVGALAAGIVVVPLLAIGPDYLPKLFPADWRGTVSEILGWVYYPGLAIGLILLLTTLYKVAPKRKHRWMRGLPGAFLAAAVFLVASTGLRLYLSYVYEHGLTYGALATPITFLLFYYFISMAIIIGAQFNNALLEYYPPRMSSKERRRRSASLDTAVPAGEVASAGPPLTVAGPGH